MPGRTLDIMIHEHVLIGLVNTPGSQLQGLIIRDIPNV